MSQVLVDYVANKDQFIKDSEEVKNAVLDVGEAEKETTKIIETSAQKRAKLIKQEEQDLKELRKRRKDAVNVKEIEGYNKRVAETEKRINTLKGKTKDLGKENSKLGASFKKVGTFIVAAFAADRLIAFGQHLFDVAKETEQFNRRAEIVFGTSFPAIQEAAENTAISLGLTTGEFIGATAAIGDLLVPLGLTRKSAAEISSELIGVSAAIKEFSADSRTTAEISGLVARSLTGETESLKTLGVVVDQSSREFKDLVKQKKEDEGATSQQAKALAIYETILKQAQPAIESYANNTESIARQQALANAELDEAVEILADSLAPTFLGLTKIGATFAAGIAHLADAFTLLTKVVTAEQVAEEKLAEFSKAEKKERDEIIKQKEKSIAVEKERLRGFTINKNVNKEILDQEREVGDVVSQNVLAAFKAFQSQETQSRRSLEAREEELVQLKAIIKAEEDDIERANAVTGSKEKQKTAFEALTESVSLLKKALLDQAVAGELDEDTLNRLIIASDKLEAAQKKVKDATTDAIEAKSTLDEKDFKEGQQRQSDREALRKDTLARGIADESKSAEDRINIIKDEQKRILENGKLTDDAKTLQTRELQDEITSIEEQAAEDRRELNREIIQASLDFAVEAIDIFREFQAQATEKQIQELEARREAQLENELLTEEGRESINKQFDDKRNALLLKQAQRDKRLALFKAGIDTAVAVVNALGSALPPLNFILAALVGALGAAQIAAIAAAPLPQFAKGSKGTPEGMSIVGEQGQEFMYTPKGTKIVDAKKTKHHGAILDAMMDGRLDEYIYQHHVMPELGKIRNEQEKAEGRQFSNSLARNIVINDKKFNDKNIVGAIHSQTTQEGKTGRAIVRALRNRVNLRSQ